VEIATNQRRHGHRRRVRLWTVMRTLRTSVGRTAARVARVLCRPRAIPTVLSGFPQFRSGRVEENGGYPQEELLPSTGCALARERPCLSGTDAATGGRETARLAPS